MTKMYVYVNMFLTDRKERENVKERRESVDKKNRNEDGKTDERMAKISESGREKVRSVGEKTPGHKQGGDRG